ncbi:MAG: hypothetical protein ICV85_11785 [Tolypothrix sp. T3-bin4]|nr:hypothetical protein [Tolypothrix sp. Co-bin9]MBD0302824.1 hypothetical protein [Tolypothrix sp. T3-bin4]
MLDINKLFPPRKWTIPLAGLVITVSVIGEQAKPVLSNQIKTVETSTLLVTDLQVSRNAVLQQRQIQANASLNQDDYDNVSSTNNEGVKLRRAGAPDKSAKPNTEAKKAPKASKVVAAKNSPKQLKTVPATTALVTDTQGARKNAGVQSANFPKQDGVYLYGQSPQPNQLGQGYIVFQKRQNQVMGALYMPSSEFSCFQGNIESSGALAMTVSAPGEGGLEQVAAANTLPKLDPDEPMTYAYSLALQDYHKLNSVSDNDHRILQMCNQASDGDIKSE